MILHRWFVLLTVLLTCLYAVVAVEPPSPQPLRRRVIVSTDFPPLDVILPSAARPGDPAERRSDPDDIQSMVRFLLYANEWDVEAILATSATFAAKANKRNVLQLLDLYQAVYANLIRKDPRYPSPDHLRSVTFEGSHGTWGQRGTANIGEGKRSEASDALIQIADRPDPRPLYIAVWGDCSAVAQAIWQVRATRTPAQLAAFLGKLRIHQIATQDGTITWLRATFPQLFIIHSEKTYMGMFGGSNAESDLTWVNHHIRTNHGPLCAAYPPEGIGCSGVCEGDSPSFLWLASANRGLNDPDDPTQPSWGGQFVRDGDTMHFVDGPGAASIAKWRQQFQEEFRERADWCLGTDH